MVSLAAVGCTSESPFPDAGPVYVAAFSELAAAADHYTIQVEKVEAVEKFEPGTTNMESLQLDRVRDFGEFSFPIRSDRLTQEDFPDLVPTLIDGGDIGKLDADDCQAFWGNFRTTYAPSNGYIRLSEIGFNEARTKAIFYMSGSCGCLCGSGYLILMEKVEDRWTVADQSQLWIA